MATTATKKTSAAAAARAAHAAQAAADGAGELYTVLSTLHHDGTIYHAGELVALDAVSAEALLQAETVEPAAKAG